METSGTKHSTAMRVSKQSLAFRSVSSGDFVVLSSCCFVTQVAAMTALSGRSFPSIEFVVRSRFKSSRQRVTWAERSSARVMLHKLVLGQLLAILYEHDSSVDTEDGFYSWYSPQPRRSPERFGWCQVKAPQIVVEGLEIRS